MQRCIERMKDVWTIVDGLPMVARVSVCPPRYGGMPVVLVHGLVVSSRYMVPMAGQLAPYFRVYAPDIPGFGRSPAPGRALSVEAQARALIGWMDAMGLDKAAFLGNSMGCQVVLELAAHYPDRVSRVVLVGPTVDPTARTMHQQTWRLLRVGLAAPTALWYIVVRDLVAAGLLRSLDTVVFGLRDPVVARLPAVRVPTLVVISARDPISPHAWAVEVVRLLPRGSLCIVPGTSHATQYDASEKVAPLVVSFLTGGAAPVDPDQACQRETLVDMVRREGSARLRRVVQLAGPLRFLTPAML